MLPIKWHILILNGNTLKGKPSHCQSIKSFIFLKFHEEIVKLQTHDEFSFPSPVVVKGFDKDRISWKDYNN
jgi:hypothetical protein